jgi:hypothetical protein
MNKTWMVFLILGLSLQAAFGTSPEQSMDGFNKRFKIVKNDQGEVTAVKMKFLSKFSISPYLVQIKNDLKEEIARIQNADKSETSAELDAFVDYMVANSDKSDEAYENAKVVRESLENLPLIDVDKAFADIQQHNVLKAFEFDLKKALKMLDLSIVADPTDARYFYRKTVTYEVVTRALNFAKKRFGNIPVLNLASFVIVKVHDLVIEQRQFHQNMLLHYLQNFETKLGMSESDVNKVFSSVYESRIGVTGYGESNRAANNWEMYGLDKFFAVVRVGNNKVRQAGMNGTMSNPVRYNFGFVEAVEDGERVVKNLMNNQHMLSSKMGTAYYYSKPNKVKRFRSLLNLGQVGLGFLPIPGWIKSLVENFAESFYVEQKRNEGALVGFFESTGNTFMMKQIARQNINPYLVL